MNGWADALSAMGGAQSLSLQHVISAMLLSFVLCSVLAKLYQLDFDMFNYDPQVTSSYKLQTSS